MDLDLEAIEKIVKKEKKSKDEKKKKSKKHKSKSRSRSEEKHKKKHKTKKSKDRRESSSRSRSKSERKKDKSKKHKREKEERKKSKERTRSKEKRKESYSKKRPSSDKNQQLAIPGAPDQVVAEAIETNKKEQIATIVQKIEETRREEEEARREDNTVTVASMSLKATEKDIYSFFNQCGKIRDIRIIRDPKSSKSKGIAYVEFYYPDAVANALNMNKKELLGYKVDVTLSYAEKNRAAQAAKKMNKNLTNSVAQINITGGKHSKVVYVANLNETLGEVTERALKDLFDPFGEIEQVDIQRDSISGRCKGFAFVHYCKADDAKEAIKKMDGFLIRDQPLKVSNVPYTYSMLVGSAISMDEENGGLIGSAEARNLLIQKFSMRDQIAPQGIDSLSTGRNDVSSVPTSVLLLTNLISSNEMEFISNPRYFAEIREEVKEECSKYGTVDNVLIESTADGNIWVKFASIKDAKNGCEKLNNKNFNGRQILCTFAKEEGYIRRMYPVQ